MRLFFISTAEQPVRPEPGMCFVLGGNNWNDYSYLTFFQLYVFLPEEDEGKLIGNIRIMHSGQKTTERTFPAEIKKIESPEGLGEEYCSLGENLTFYEELFKVLGRESGRQFLTYVNDASFDPRIRQKFEDERCFQVSLLRYSSGREALDKGGALFGGTVNKVESFKATITLPGASSAHVLEFDFLEAGGMPHRVNLLVGINGVGKTQLMANLAILLSNFADIDDSQLEVEFESSSLSRAGSLSPIPSIYNVISVSFSAFDNFEIPTEIQSGRFQYSYCGLRKKEGGVHSEAELLSEIIRLIKNMEPDRRSRLAKNVGSLVRVDDLDGFFNDPELNKSLYGRLSAGQRISLNIACHLMDKIQENTLVLIDEPETHLHPKLMTTLFSVISGILSEFNSFAIIATHSPIIVQQVPSRYISVIGRERSTPLVGRPLIECFGENLSEISRSVFVAVENDRDYESVLEKLLKSNNGNVDKVASLFPRGLSMNARIFLNSLVGREE